MRFLMMPGDLVCDWVGLEPNSDNRQILRMFLNTVLWGAIGVSLALRFAG